MTTDSEQFAPELLARNGRVSEPANVRLATVRADSPSGLPQIDYVSGENPLPVRIENPDETPPATAFFNSALTTTVVVVRNGPTYVSMFEASNINALDAYVQFFNADRQAVTLGTTVPLMAFLVPHGDTTNRGANDKTFPEPLYFPRGLAIAATTTATGSTAPSTGLVVNMAVR